MTPTIKDKLWRGVPFDCNGLCYVYPFTVNQIIAFPEEDYNKYVNLLTLSDTELQEIKKVEKISFEGDAFEYLMLCCGINDTFLLEFAAAFSTFIREKVLVSPKTREIFIGESADRKITKQDFFEFQNIIRLQNCLSVKEPIPENETPIEKKFRLRREQAEAVKRKGNQKKGEALSLSELMSSVIALEMGETWKTVGDLYIYPLRELFERGQVKNKFNTDLRMIAAGADPKKIKPKHFIGNLD